MKDIVQFTQQELDRIAILQACIAGHLRNGDAAEQLQVSVRQVKRLKQRLQCNGTKDLASKQRGQPSHNQLDAETKAIALKLLHERYADFGPTLAHEKLLEVHHLALSRETVRHLMIAEGLWKAHRAKPARIHPLRTRRARRGELIQIDGSPFAWFEDRGPTCTLLVFIDDATGELMQLLFTKAESTHSYFQATEQYLRQHGRPQAFYSDKLGVFRINHPNAAAGEGTTQFGRALYELDIELICANTPEAKGRVERANQTLQDRLVRELRLQGISDMDAANAYLPTFCADFNRRFAVAPRDPVDAHRPLRPADDLLRILALREWRTLSKNLTLQYNNAHYQIQTERPGYTLRFAKVEVRERWDGAVAILYKGKPLTYTLYREPPRQAELITSKMLNAELDARLAEKQSKKKKRKSAIPAPEHPWRKFRINNKSD